MKFEYKAFDQSGKSLAGSTDAADISAASESLRRQGMFVAEIHEVSTAHLAGNKKRVGTGKRLKRVAMLSRQLQVLVTSGTPLAQAVAAIERQMPEGDWKIVLASMRKKLEEGSPLSAAMAMHPNYFDALCRSLVSAGEASGNMGAMLERLAQLTRKQLAMRNAIVGALAYPVVLIFIGVCVLINMLLFVLPRFEMLFAQLDTPLPPTTKFLMMCSKFLQVAWWAPLGAVIGGFFGGRAYFRSATGKRHVDHLLISLPKAGAIMRSIMTAKTARMLGTLLECKVPLLETLQLAREATTHSAYAKLLAEAEESVGRGEPMSAVMGRGNLLVACVQEAIRNGETTGQIGQPLLQMADFLDEENDVIIKSLTRLIEPLILVLLGAMVGFIALSMFLPLFDLVAAAGK